MLFKSPYAAMRFNIWPTRDQRHPVTGEIIETVPGYVAEFGQIGPEVTFENPETGRLETTADIQGHFYDSELATKANGEPLTDDERDTVESLLLSKCRSVPMYVSLVQKVAVKAVAPWASYDTMSPEDVVDAAQLLSLVPEAVAYERENAQRPAVLETLEEVLSGLAEAEIARSEPALAFPDGALDLPRRVGGVVEGGEIGSPQARTDGGIMLGGRPA